jgi:2'-5' RNA ligase
MYFDGEADAAVRRLWQRLADAGLPSLATRTHRRHRPHVSLAVAESLADVDPGSLRSVLMSGRPTLSLYTLSTFPAATGVLFLGVQVTAELLAFHADVHAALGGQPIRQWAYYLPGNWIPHCALAEGLDRSEAGRALELLADYRPITAEVTSAGIKDTATGAITLLAG